MAKRAVFILSNLATSVDGKIATHERRFFPLGTGADLKEMLRLRKSAQAVIIGASTLRPYRKPMLSGRTGKQPINVIVSSSLKGLSLSWPFFKDRRIRRILFTSTRAPAALRKKFARSCDVVVLGANVSAPRMIRELAKRGVRRAVVEGGGTLMWDFARENLIDEYHVTLTPRILGGTEAPTLVDGPGFTAARSLKLKLSKVRRKGDELYLVYRST
jgi:2,5-diamino-6-(ribosylamino)-4(3H)-pyrimidinone 5'-phosphate reductase